MSTLTTVRDAALLAVKNKDAIHYTQNSPARWEGIHNKLIAAKGQFPRYADCSSFVTWCLWQVLGSGPDIVNGTDWKSGYTGTLAQHGHVVSEAEAQVDDLVFYGNPIYHVAIVIGRQNGVLLVASHGEESGPYIVKYNQWGVNSIRRYLPTAAPAPSGPTLHRAWPPYCSTSSDVMGPRSNPSSHVHGGINPAEQADVKAYQIRLIILGCVSGVTNTSSGWADGIWESPTTTATKVLQAKHRLPQTGVCNEALWKIAFTY
jgi:hypothetical protein